ncbi:MAG: response regulator [Anaeromyxobacteraceae bacterium]
MFDRASGARLETAERFVLSLPALFPGALAECDLALQQRTAILALVMRFDAARFDAAARQRLDFWCARAGVRATALDALGDAQREVFLGNVARCEPKLLAVPAARLADELAPLFAAAGAPEGRCRAVPERPTLAIDAGGPGFTGVRFDASARTLFVPGVLAPPAGDALVLALRLPGGDRPVELPARVTGGGDGARPAAAGFTLALDCAEEVAERLEHLACPQPARASAEQRAHPRYAVKASVLVASCDEPIVAVPRSSADAGAAFIEYATDQELAADFVDNLSQGGAFVRTAHPAPVGSRVNLTMRLPCGDELTAPAVVAMTSDKGMGVRFELDERGQARLAAAIARISARPRRALVVDDDALVCRMLQEALRGRGFEVLTARDGAAGLSLLADELLALDLLVTDVKMPHMDGETLVRTIRRAGGESELAIVVVTGAMQPGLEQRLERDGADAVLDKALGPDLIAQAADAVLERKRLALQELTRADRARRGVSPVVQNRTTGAPLASRER